MKLTQKINFKITARFLLLFLIALSLLLVIASSLFSSKLNSELKLVSEQKMSLLTTELNHSLVSIRSLYFSFIHDPRLQELMQLYDAAQEQPARDELSLLVRQRLSESIYNHASVRSAMMLDKDCTVLDPIYSSDLYKKLLLQETQYDAFVSSQLTGRFSPANSFPILEKNATYNTQYTISYLGHYYNNRTYEDLGTVAINYSKLALLMDIEPMFSSSFDYAFVVDENQNLVLSSSAFPGEISERILEAEPSSIVSDRGRSYAVFSASVPDYNNWKIYGVIDYQSVISPVKQIVITLFVIALFVLVGVLWVSVRVSVGITTPLRTLGKAMTHVGKGKWEILPESANPDEVGLLIAGYNQMVRSLESLTARITRQQNEKKEIEIAMLQSRLDLLQSQINPHFIHNTLNTMNYMAQKANVPELVHLILSFNGLLRSSMSTHSMFNTVAEEVENLQRYLDIQLTRYDIDLQCRYEVSEDAEQVMIPKLILQPLVENSLFHGIVPMGGGMICVRMCVGEDRLWVSVFDDGAGIPEEKLATILDGTLKNTRGYSSIGLTNVADRLVLTYGDTSRLVVESHTGGGTTISFSIPLSEK